MLEVFIVCWSTTADEGGAEIKPESWGVTEGGRVGPDPPTGQIDPDNQMVITLR